MKNDRRSLPGPEDVALRRLDNGVLLAARENFVSPAVVVRGILEVGSMDESPEKGGLASMVAALLTRGTTRQDYEALNEAIEGVGASLGVGGRTHTTSASAKCLAEDFPAIIALLADMLRHPTFPEEHLERVRWQRITALRERQQNTQAVAELAFYAMAFPPAHPYHDSSSGTPETVESLARADLVAFQRAYYGPTEAIFVVVGAVAQEEA
ncbi:MAG: M16 family metallopeptidase, partial [Ardenticatenaceae bacterium]